MSSEKLRKLNEFEWSSAARYILYISAVVGLSEINANRVNSFGFERLGLDKLLKQKTCTLSLLESNKSKLESFVGRRSSELSDNEKSVLRTMYIQHNRSEETVRGHIALLRDFVVQIEMGLIDSGGDAADEPLF